MTTAAIKTKLQQMIKRETDMDILQTIHTILQRANLNQALKEKLTVRALKSEEDIIAGRVFSKKEVVQRTTR